MRLLLALTVALVATEVHGLKCYNCAGEDCTAELECPSGSDACLITTASKIQIINEMLPEKVTNVDYI